MKKLLSKLCFVVVLFTTCGAFAQLNNFTIYVTGTAQTCLGNGSLSFTVNGNNPDAALEFAVYLLPNITTPVTTVTNYNALNLVSGNYLVVATQTLNGESNTASANATIIDSTVPLIYTAAVTDVSCNNNGIITINVTSGTAVSYEIISGPMLVTAQPSNIFTNLPLGQYQVRVFDNCGDALVTTVQVSQAFTNMFVYNQQFVGGELPSCNTILVSHDFGVVEDGDQIFLPLTFQYTIHPPGGGADVIVTQQVNSASPNIINTVVSEIPFYNDQLYYYDVTLTDACGNQFFQNNNIVNKKFDFALMPGTDTCSKFYLDFGLDNYRLPCTVTFLSAPSGFNPASFNTSNPVISTAIFSYGSDANPVPYGDYSVQITDACGRSSVQNLSILGEGVPTAGGVVSAVSCLGTISIKTAFGREIVSVTITSAPAGYLPALPQDVSGYASGDQFSISDMPLGAYTLVLVDICGATHTLNVTITAPPVDLNLYLAQAQGCAVGEGSVMIFPGGSGFVSVNITAGPAALGQPLPINVSNNIDNEGDFYMNSLPAGGYDFETVDNCGNVRQGHIDLEGYTEYANTTHYIPNCGSFDIDLHHSDNNQGTQRFWLQKLNEATGLWGHPITGETYLSDTFPSTSNSIQIYNNQLNVNFAFTGQFRVIEVMNVFSNGGDYTTAFCNHEIYNFTYTGAPAITGAYAFPCTNGLAEVILQAVGVPPLQYATTTKNGQPFVINNGTSSVFLSLEQAVYNFQVTDDCNNVVNILFDITALSPLQIEPTGFCNGQASSLFVPEFTFLTYEWFRADAPNVILGTDNKLDFPTYNQDLDSGIYSVHIVSTVPGSCIDLVINYDVEPASLPDAGGDSTTVICIQGTEIDLAAYLTTPHQEGGVWEEVTYTGYLNGSMLNTQFLTPGTYQFNYTVTSCNFSDEAIITLDLKGHNTFDVLLQGGCNNEHYILSIANLADLGQIQQAVWTGPSGYAFTGLEADITDLPSGVYTVTVTNIDGCSAFATITVNNTSCSIPRGISPNGDGLNDGFDLTNLDVQHLEIFNRYGMQVYEKDNYINEWKGQSDKGELVTGTYFYVVTLPAGKKVTGWVYLQREIH